MLTPPCANHPCSPRNTTPMIEWHEFRSRLIIRYMSHIWIPLLTQLLQYLTNYLLGPNNKGAMERSIIASFLSTLLLLLSLSLPLKPAGNLVCFVHTTSNAQGTSTRILQHNIRIFKHKKNRHIGVTVERPLYYEYRLMSDCMPKIAVSIPPAGKSATVNLSLSDARLPVPNASMPVPNR